MRRFRGIAPRSIASCRRGSTAIEFGLVITPLVVLLLGGVEFGRAMWIQNALNFAVEQAARCASINTTSCGTTQATQNFAAAASGAGIAASIFTVTLSANPGGCNSVSATYPFTMNIPMVNHSINLTAQSCYPK